MMAPSYFNGNLDVLRIIMRIMYGGNRTPLSAISSCGMYVTPSMALVMHESPYLTILYLPMGALMNLEHKSQGCIGDIRG